MGIGAWEYVPGVGDVYDIYHGGKKAFDPNLDWGQRAMGAGQMALGIGGLATLGGGSLLKNAGKAGIKIAGKAGAKKFMTQKAKDQAIKAGENRLLTNLKYGIGNIPYNMAKASYEMSKIPGFRARNLLSDVPFRAAAGISDYLFGVPDNTSKTGKDIMEGENGELNVSTSNSGGYGGNISLGSNGISGLTPEQQSNILKQIAQGGENGGYGYDDEGRRLVQDYMYNQQMMEPYRRNLQNYIRDYDTRSDWAYNQDKRLALLAALTGATGLNQMIGKNNAIVNEANRLGLMKTAGEDLKSVGEGMNTLVGNMNLARMTGLPLSAANADSKMAQLAVNKMIADNKNENRLAVEQYKGQMRLQYAQLQARLKAQLRAGDRAGAANTFKQLNAYSKALKLASDYGLTADDIYRNTGVRFNIPENVGQVGDIKI